MRKIIVVCACLVLPSSVWSVVSFLNNQGGSEKAAQGTTSPLTANFSVTNSGSNRCAIALICFDFQTGMSTGTVTYGGQTMTPVGKIQNTNSNIYAVIEYLYNPPTGSNTLSVAINGTINDIYADLLAFTGCNSVTPVRAASFISSTTINSTTIGVTIPSNTNDLTVSVDCDASGTTASTTNQTIDDSQTAGSNSILTDHSTTGASNVTHTWTSNAGDKALVGVSIDGDSVAATTNSCEGIIGDSIICQ